MARELSCSGPRIQRASAICPSVRAKWNLPKPATRSVGGIEISLVPRADWTREQIHGLFDLPFNDLLFRCPVGSPAGFRPERRAGVDAVVDQDRGMPGGLCLLSAEHSLFHRRRERRTHERRERPGGRSEGERCRRDAFLSRRSLSWSEGSTCRADRRDDSRGSRAGSGDVRDARPVDGEPGGGAGRFGTRLLQPQPGHVGVVLFEHHHHAKVHGSSRDPGSTFARPD